MALALALPDEAATRLLGRRLAEAARIGDIFALEGALGSGKSVLARAFVRALMGANEEVPSPTFTLVQTYASPRGTIWHFDLFRLRKPEEALELGIEEAFGGGISLIEWPERLGAYLPPGRLMVRLSAGIADDARRAEIEPGHGWEARLAALGLAPA